MTKKQPTLKRGATKEKEPGRYSGSTPFRAAREEAGVSRKAVADALGWTLNRAWSLENGKREPAEGEAKAWADGIKKAVAAKPACETEATKPTRSTTTKKTATRKPASKKVTPDVIKTEAAKRAAA